MKKYIGLISMALIFALLPEGRAATKVEYTALNKITLAPGENSGSFEFDLGSQTESVLIGLRQLEKPKGQPLIEILITELEGPNGDLFANVKFDSEGNPNLDGQSRSRNSFINLGTFLLESNSKKLLMSGKYRGKFVVYSTFSEEKILSPITIQIETYTKCSPKIASTGSLSVRFYFTGSDGLMKRNRMDSLSAQDTTWPTFSAEIQETRRILKSAGISLSIVESKNISEVISGNKELLFFDLDPNAKKILDSKSLAKLMQIRTLKKLADREEIEITPDVLNIVFVNMIESDVGGANGISVGAPAHPHYNTIFVATDKTSNEVRADSLGTVIAHEIGHALGLFHLNDNGITDPFDDTELNRSNIMQAGSGYKELKFSRQQKALVLKSPLIKRN